MKNIIVIFAVVFAFTTCKKNKTTTTPPADIYCIFYNQTCVGCQARVFYKCASTEAEMQQACITLRNDNKFYEVTRKATCSECK